MAPSTDEILAHRGRRLLDSHGAPIGKIEEIYLDAHTGDPAWALTRIGRFRRKRTLVPLRHTRIEDGELAVVCERSQVKRAPEAAAPRPPSAQEEHDLYRHYRLPVEAT